MKHDETPVLAYIVEPCWTSCFVNHDFLPAEIHRFLCSYPTIGWTTHGLCWWKPMFHVLRGRQWGASAHSYSVVKDPRHCTGCAFWSGSICLFSKSGGWPDGLKSWHPQGNDLASVPRSIIGAEHWSWTALKKCRTPMFTGPYWSPKVSNVEWLTKASPIISHHYLYYLSLSASSSAFFLAF